MRNRVRTFLFRVFHHLSIRTVACTYTITCSNRYLPISDFSNGHVFFLQKVPQNLKVRTAGLCFESLVSTLTACPSYRRSTLMPFTTHTTSTAIQVRYFISPSLV